MDDDRFVLNKGAISRVVAPDALRFRVGGRATEYLSLLPRCLRPLLRHSTINIDRPVVKTQGLDKLYLVDHNHDFGEIINFLDHFRFFVLVRKLHF